MNHLRMFAMILLTGSLLLGSSDALAQKQNEIGPGFQTTTTNIKSRETDKRPGDQKRKNMAFIYVKDTRGILYGNPCATEATRKMRFEYIMQVQGHPGSVEEKEMFYNNVGVKLRLFFTRSPFWKLILKKRLRECAYSTGDVVG